LTEERNAVTELREAVLRLEPKATELAARRALQLGVRPLDAIENGLIAGIKEVGAKFECGEFFLSELVMGAEAFKAGAAVLEPELRRTGGNIKPAGVIIMGTVSGDIHSIGKDIVTTLLTAAGFKVDDLGVDVPVARFVEAVRTSMPDVVGMSALMSTTIPTQREVIRALQTAGLRDKVKIVIGGAATSDVWRKEIGADAWGASANEGVRKVMQLVGAS
jgi:corrinoid protein of di/trimethylamine methyltransferase